MVEKQPNNPQIRSGEQPSGYTIRARKEHLVKIHGTYYCLVSHEEIGDLIGNLMQLCDLMGDTEQRKAFKSEIKHRTRQWLDDRYWLGGFEKFFGYKLEESDTMTRRYYLALLIAHLTLHKGVRG